MPHFIARFLVVDDQPASFNLLLAYLKDREIDLLVAQNGEDALRIAADGMPDLILLDVMMPGGDGFAICTRLKAEERTARIPVIFLSAAMETEDKLRGFAAGAADYITKPFFEQEVLARVLVQLGDQQRLRALTSPVDQGLGEASFASSAKRDRRMLNQAIAILTRQLTQPPSGIDLAHQVGTYQQRLTRVFREQVGMSPCEYLQQLRLERGRGLLNDTDLQVQLIADRVGYRNAGDFTRAFRRHFAIDAAKSHLSTYNGWSKCQPQLAHFRCPLISMRPSRPPEPRMSGPWPPLAISCGPGASAMSRA
ncbi:Stalked cell differentiation-controlling protein [Thiorhodovibrio winogradskyi]|uniref:Stalked cell differentiation-controlling protein n=1 Tax=Thiorhodovibrio winogradskyi TaxID=77007 RepID=A0ABZ0S8B4_9GAMM|nr:response regulator [Thiorhodovibrio winogradskyi]